MTHMPLYSLSSVLLHDWKPTIRSLPGTIPGAGPASTLSRVLSRERKGRVEDDSRLCGTGHRVVNITDRDSELRNWSCLG